MAVKRYDAKFYLRNDVIDQITPKVVVQRNIQAPHGPWKPAGWLPVQFTKTNADAGTDAFVISSGKAVSLDREGRIVPAGMRLLLESGAGSLVYTATDVDWGVYDLTTGERLTSTQSYSDVEVAEALLERGLVLEQEVLDASGTIPPTTGGHAATIIDLFISAPVGVAHYDMHVWSGLPEDGDQHYVNYSKQHAVQFLTEVQMQMPHLVPVHKTDDVFDVATLDAGGSTAYVAGDPVSPGEYWNATNVSQLARYSGTLTATSPVVALGLDPAGDSGSRVVARNTDRTPFTATTSGTGVLVRERASASALSLEGDWYLDAEVGVLFLHSDTWATLVAGAVSDLTFDYYYYDATAASAHRHLHFDDIGKPGDYVTYDEQSNFRVATAAEIAAGVGILGRLLKIDVQPKGLLSSVKTAFNFSNAPATAQMPGSATKGFTDLITLSEETVADQVAIINLRVI